MFNKHKEDSLTRNDLPSPKVLADLHHTGITLTDLASRFGCNRQTIANKIRSIGKEIKHMRNPQHPHLQLPPLSQLRNEYKDNSLRVLAEKYGVSHQTIANRISLK